MAVKNFMTRGNQKLAKNILCWSITPIVSCINCKNCAKDCYAMKAYNQYPNVKKAWDRNLMYSHSADFMPYIIGQLKRSQTAKTVRIHVAGDFHSDNYIRRWGAIVKMFPTIKFYAYTKVFALFKDELNELDSLPNCNIINSIAFDGGNIYGDDTRIEKLVSAGYYLCPAVKGADVICGKDCSYCITGKLPCFKQH